MGYDPIFSVSFPNLWRIRESEHLMVRAFLGLWSKVLHNREIGDLSKMIIHFGK